MGAVKKPEMTFRAIHWPCVFAYGLKVKTVSHIVLFLLIKELRIFLPPHCSTLR
jgi:hypothetical protein